MSSEIIIGQVPFNKISTVWNDIEEGIKGVLNMYDCEVTIEEVKQNLDNNEWQLILATRDSKLLTALICSPQQYHDYSVMFIHIAYGIDFDAWRDPMIDFVKQGAKKYGAKFIEWRGRQGFIKKLKDIAVVKHVSMLIPVEN